MALVFLVFYGVAVLLIVGGGALVFRLLRRRGGLLATLAALATMGLLVLVWPLPIHGGFMLLGEALLDEWSRERSRGAAVERAHAGDEFEARLAQRFAGELPITTRTVLRDGWELVTLEADGRAWLDTGNRLVWSEWLELPNGEDPPPLAIAKRRCAEHAPVGYWGLATEAERALSWEAGGTRVMPAAPGASVSYVVDSDLRLEMPTYAVRGGSNTAPGNARRFHVQCVARAPGAPLRGYMKRDIPLERWNRYQLGKLAG